MLKTKVLQKLNENKIFAKTNDIAGDDAPCPVKWKGGGGEQEIEFTELKIKLSFYLGDKNHTDSLLYSSIF